MIWRDLKKNRNIWKICAVNFYKSRNDKFDHIGILSRSLSDWFTRFVLSFLIEIHEIATSKMYVPFIIYIFPWMREWSIDIDRIVDIIKLLAHPEVGILQSARPPFQTYNRTHRCLLFADIVHANWSLGRYWRSSPGSDSTMRNIMLFHLPLPSPPSSISSPKADPRSY